MQCSYNLQFVCNPLLKGLLMLYATTVDMYWKFANKNTTVIFIRSASENEIPGWYSGM